jgi:CubicO group peptidase (beta-lactamase class C family)/pimeloyl-ACP methyl ester carboxylesterase
MLAVAIGCANGQVTPPLAPGLQQVIRELDRTATASVAKGSLSFGLAVVTADGPAWTMNYGYADSTKLIPAGADTSYRVGGEAFTGIMLLQLAHDGKVHLSDRVDKYLPEINRIPVRYPDAAPLTLLQLATHSSGLELRGAADAGFAKSTIAQWESALVSALPRARFAYEPGTHVAETGINEAILAAALSRAAGQPYAEYVRHKIFAPLAMTHSEFEPNGNLGEEITIPVKTTIGDMVKFAQFEMLGGPDTVLPRRDLEANYRRTWLVNSVSVPNPTEGVGIGYAGETWTSNGNSHYYFIPPIGPRVSGYGASFWFEPRTHSGMVLLQHGDGPALGEMIHSYVYTLNAQKVDAGSQVPKRPFPYREESVSLSSPAEGVSLSGTLSIPEGAGPFPALVLVQPLGPLDRDEPLLNHRPFLVLADYLARKGIAVLRYDVRGVGKSSGKFAGVTRKDLAGDVRAATAYLRTRPEIDVQRMGLLGHADGGRTAAMAADRNPDVSFLVVLSTASVPASEAYAERNLLNAEASGGSYAAAEEQAVRDRKVAALVAGEADAAILERKLREVLTEPGGEDEAARVKQLTSPGFRNFLIDDPAKELRSITCPLLALYGEKDLSVPSSIHVPAMRKLVQDAGNPKSEVRQFQNLNSLLQTSDTGLGREAVWAEETMAPIALETIGGWILKVSGR